MTTATAALPEQFLLHLVKDIQVNAPPQVTWDAMLEQIGPGTTHPDGSPMPLTLEAWPGGRYFRDLGSNTGHLWGHVQVIKPPTLLEIRGPLFMSYPAINFVQYRLTAEGRGTRITLTHRAFGDLLPEHREGVHKGWQHFLTRIRDRAQR